MLFDYHGIPVYIRLGLSTETPERALYMGPKGILDTTEYGIRYSPQAGIDTSPSYYDNSFPKEMQKQYKQEWHAKHNPKIGKEPMTEDVSYSGDDWDDLKPHLLTFFEAVRSRKANVKDAVFGNHAAIACHMANESYFRKRQVDWDATSRTIKNA
ncbi:MAG: hypothetical protein ABI164_04320 [Acidobacteriaceae bacterium]